MNKIFIAVMSLLLVIACIIYLPVLWLIIITSLVLWGISFYLYIQLKRTMQEELKKYNAKFVDSGNAITDTLRVAFDNIKKNARSTDQLQAPLSEIKARVHRLEQTVQRISGQLTNRPSQAEQRQNNNEKKK